MYTIKQIFGISREPYSRYQILDLPNEAVSDIFFTYRKVYLTLTAPFLTNDIYVDMDDLRAKYTAFEGTLVEMLVDNNNDTLPTVSSVPVPAVKHAYFSDAFRAGYSVDIIGRNLNIDSGLPKKYKIDLRVTRPNRLTDMRDIYDHSFVTVNGYFHMTDCDDDYLYVMDGGGSNYLSRQNQLGIWSFKNVAPVKHIPITENMIFRQSNVSHLSARTYIRLPENTDNKTVFLILGGYLVKVEKGIFFPVGNDTYCLNLANLPLLERYYESLNTIDYSSLNLQSSTNNSEQISIEEFYNDITISKYLTLSQSFISVIDKRDIFMNKHFIRHSNLPGMFTAYKEPKEPLFTGFGKVSEYWKTYEDGQWSVTVADSFLQNKVFNSVTRGDLTTVGNSNIPSKTFYNSMGYLLEVGSDF
jgi:hypothetical protein